MSSRVAIDEIRFQELPHCIKINKDLDRKLSFTEVICKLKIGDVGRLEAIGPATTVDRSDDNIFDESIYTDCSLIRDDVDRSNCVRIIGCSATECVNTYRFTAVRFNAEFLS